MNDYQPTEEQIEALARLDFERMNPDFKFDLMSARTKERGTAKYRELVATPEFQSLVRAAQAEAVREAGTTEFQPSFGISYSGLDAQQRLHRRADRIEAPDA
ncbi:hypothetical protein OVA14_07080 [Agrococcus sp. SL85]|uniref:hypothetical protein n=1 Tax=Agrococcus sp. SL85 TaxID=2995141 RepID=UPI00226D31D2|nr:hypothetical protein [Agrococcus sp. SL85]WAC65156.1 hypothetical protein OVA14_07080 [Agrococcus sp. SL85]